MPEAILSRNSQTTSLMRTPRTVDIEITGRCNLRCLYCYFFDTVKQEYPEVPTSEWLAFFSELGRAAVMDVCLAGGEPFIREDLPLLIKSIVRNRMRFSILTNGTLIDDPMADFLHSTNRCNAVQVSLDGSEAAVHNKCRPGSFTDALKGIKILQKHRIPVTVRVTLHRDNIDDLENIARLLLEDLHLPGFSTNGAGNLGACRGRPELQLTNQDRRKVMATLLHLCKRYPGRITAQAGPLAELLQWNSMIKSVISSTADNENGGFLTGCGCPWTSVTVRADGAYIPCTMLSHLTMGRINRDSLVRIWQENPILNSLRRRREISLTAFPRCRQCKFRRACTGNCPGLAYGHTGIIDHPSPDACLDLFLNNGGAVPPLPAEMLTENDT